MAEKRSCCYLIMNGKGVVYLGATSNLKDRLHYHNSKSNRGYTRGKGRWHLLSARVVASTKEAFSKEQKMKKNPLQKQRWKATCLERAKLIGVRFNYNIDFTKWPPLSE